MYEEKPVARHRQADITRTRPPVLGNQAGDETLSRAFPALPRTVLQRSRILRSPGRPLDAETRADMEARLGADFGTVRMHTGPAAAESAAGLGARAYTSGEHIVLGEGGADRHTLAHELTHVIQQRGGPVAGTDSGDGLKVSDPSDRFEREAEANATRALQGRPDAVVTEPAVAGRGTTEIQRKVGLEFETGWMVRRRGKVGDLLGTKGSSLRKKDPIGVPFTGFKLEADETNDKQSEVEFIVDPAVEEGAAGRAQLAATMAQITVVGDAMRTAAGALTNPALTSFTQDQATGRPTDSKFVITPPTDDHGLRAGPQVTAGVKLDMIEQLDQALAVPGQVAPAAVRMPGELDLSTGFLATRARNVGGQGALANPGPELRGLIAVISTYLVKGSSNLPLAYPKQMGDVLLARTDFGQLFLMLPPAEQAALVAAPNLWVDLVMTEVNRTRTGLTRNDSVISAGIQRPGSRKRARVPDLTIDQWLTGILTGLDRLRQVRDAESMGEFGNRDEAVGPAPANPAQARPRAGIFEFRGAQGTKIPLTRWTGFALEFHDYITRLHS